MREKRIEDLKKRMLNLLDQINALGNHQLQVHQQRVTKEHLCFMGGNGRIWITPCTAGYDISLSGKSLENQMYPFMRDLCGRECDGYKQTNARLGRKDNPFWRVNDFELVKKAVFRYASTSA
jgi:hypothetical protein